jgi:hypothetical protein
VDVASTRALLSLGSIDVDFRARVDRWPRERAMTRAHDVAIASDGRRSVLNHGA